MELGLTGRVAVVAAPSRGLGRASAEALGREGAQLLIAARGAESLRACEHDLEKAGVEVLAVEADVTEADVPAELVSTAIDALREARHRRREQRRSSAGPGPRARRRRAAAHSSRTSSPTCDLSVPHSRISERPGGVGSAVSPPTASCNRSRTSRSRTPRAPHCAWAKTAAADLLGSGVTLNLALPGPHATDRMCSSLMRGSRRCAGRVDGGSTRTSVLVKGRVPLLGAGGFRQRCRDRRRRRAHARTLTTAARPVR